MKHSRFAVALLALCAFVATIGYVAAQDTDKEHQKTRSMTGCLQKGDNANEFRLIAADGSKWDVKSDSVKLGAHVGHTVKVDGVVENASAHGMKEDVKKTVDKGATETGDLTVTNLAMVSSSCK